LENIREKINTFNSLCKDDNKYASFSLTEKDFADIDQIIKLVKPIISDNTAAQPIEGAILSDRQNELLQTLIRVWPFTMIFPILDLFRLVILLPNIAKNYFKKQLLVETLLLAANACLKYPDAEVSQSVLRLVLHCVANMFGTRELKETALEHVDSILEWIGPPLKQLPTVSNLKAYSSILLNYSICLCETPTPDKKMYVLNACLEFLRNFTLLEKEPEHKKIVFFSMSAIGNLIYEDEKLTKLALKNKLEIVLKEYQNHVENGDLISDLQKIIESTP